MKLRYITFALLAGMAITGCNKNGGTPAPEEPVLREIAITHQPNKTVYDLNEALDLTGLEVTAYYTSGDPRVVTDYQTYGFSSAVVNPSVVVTVKYVDKTTTFTVAVEDQTPVLQSIAVTTAPTKTAYNEGEIFDPAGMVVTGTFDRGEPQDVTNQCTFPSTPLVLGQTSVTITCNGKEATQAITVSAAPIPVHSINYVNSYGHDYDGIDLYNSNLPTEAQRGATVHFVFTLYSGFEYVGWGVPFDYEDTSFYEQFEKYDFTEREFDIVMPDFDITVYFGVREEVAKYGVFFDDEAEHLTFAFVTSGQSYAEGAEVKFTVTPDEGWELDGMPTNVGGETLTIQKNLNDEYYFTMPGHAVNITATAKEKEVTPPTTYSVTFASVEHATFTKHPAISMTGLEEGETFMFKVTFDEGWEANGNPYCSNRSDVFMQVTTGSYNWGFVMPAGDVTITIDVKESGAPVIASHNLTYVCRNVDTNEIISNEALGATSTLPTSAEEGATVNLNVVAAEGYEYVYFFFDMTDERYDSDFWDMFEDYTMNESAISFTMPTYDVEFIFFFNVPEVPKHTITYSPVNFDDGSAMAAALATTSILPDEVEEGAEVTINVVAASGYIYKGFAFDSTDPKYDQDFWDQFIGYDMTESTITFNMPAYDIEIFLRFVADEGGEGGEEATIEGSYVWGKRLSGADTTFTLTLNDDGTGTYVRSPNSSTDSGTTTTNFTWKATGTSIKLTLVSTGSFSNFGSYRPFPSSNVGATNTVTWSAAEGIAMSLYNSSGNVYSTETFARQAA